MSDYAHQRVFSTGARWTMEEVEPGCYRRVYVADDKYMDAPLPTEQTTMIAVFAEMLRTVTADGGRKRAAGTKPPWWRDGSHEAAIFSHLDRWKHGVLKDHDSGAHPLVHLACRALMIAHQETHGQVDPEVAADEWGV